MKNQSMYYCDKKKYLVILETPEHKKHKKRIRGISARKKKIIKKRPQNPSLVPHLEIDIRPFKSIIRKDGSSRTLKKSFTRSTTLFIVPMLAVTRHGGGGEIGGRRKWKGKEGKKTRDEINSILAWRVGARGRRGLLRGEASGQMELDCTLSVGGWSDSFEG